MRKNIVQHKEEEDVGNHGGSVGYMNYSYIMHI